MLPSSRPILTSSSSPLQSNFSGASLLFIISGATDTRQCLHRVQITAPARQATSQPTHPTSIAIRASPSLNSMTNTYWKPKMDKSLCTIQRLNDGFKRYVVSFIGCLRCSNHQALVCDSGRNKHFYISGKWKLTNSKFRWTKNYCASSKKHIRLQEWKTSK